MRILHIGDFHYRGNKNEYEQNNIVAKLKEQLVDQESIDLILFSGDLVFSGEKKVDFIKAHELLLTPLQNCLGVNEKNLFVCQGNHDIDRNESLQSIIDFFSNKETKINSNDDLNKWINTAKKDLEASLQTGKRFFEYSQEFFKEGSIEFNEFITINERILDEKKVAIITLNSSWLCSGFQNDKGNLFFPTEILKNAIPKIATADLKIIMLHHPLQYFKEFNSIELQELIHREFNLMFVGHVHKEKIEIQFNSKNGIYCNTTQATLCFDNGDIGYSILNIDFEDLQLIKLERGHFVSKENVFLNLEPVMIPIPCGEEKYKQNRLRNKITGKFNFELETSNQLLLNYNGENKRGFIDTFTNPVLSTKSDTESTDEIPTGTFDFEILFNQKSNYLVFGKDKCGKTSLLKKIQLHYLKNYPYSGVIPFYIDYKEFENTDPSKFNLSREVARYYELNTGEGLEIVKSGRFLLLIDNLNTLSPIHSPLLSFIKQAVNIKFIICSEYLATRVFIEEIDNLEYDKLYFKNLTRKEIRIYTQKQPNVKEEDQSVVLEKITNICSQLQLPLNYWTISLILLIYKKHNDDYSKNLFSVLDACVDEILNKKRFIFEKTNLKFEQYKVICSQIAHYLLIFHREKDYTSDYASLIAFIDNCISKNPRIVSDSKSIFDYLFEVGILKTKSNGYTFRLNGIFEYFLAFYIKDNPSFKDEILENDSIYLAFKNELELYSGFHRNDADFLQKIFAKTRSKFDPIIEKLSGENSIDENLLKKITTADDFAKIIKSLRLNNPLKHTLQDHLMDEINPLATDSEVHIKEIVDTSYINFELLERYLSILSRVFKNLDSIEDIDLINTIFDYLLNCYCYIGFHFIEEYEEFAKEENIQNLGTVEEEIIIGEEILKLMSRVIPVLIQAMLYDGIGHINIRRIIENKIEEYKVDSKNNQYKLFLLYFLLVDIDINDNKDTIDDIFETINLAPLKVATLFKLNFYLGFKAYKNPKLEAFLKNKIQKAQLRLDNKTDIGELQKMLSRQQKRNIVKRNKMK